jgi:hypothetical protein
MISKTQKTNEDENQALAAQVKKRNKREEGNPKKSKRPCYKKMRQRSYATVTRIWDIIPFNV